MKQLKKGICLKGSKGAFFLCLSLLFFLSGCGGDNKDEAPYKLLSVQDFSHKQVGKFSAKVYVTKGLTEDTMKEIIKEITQRIRKENNADVVWLSVYQSKIPTFNTLIATTQWINGGLKKELRFYEEKSEDSILFDNSPVYITWKK